MEELRIPSSPDLAVMAWRGLAEPDSYKLKGKMEKIEENPYFPLLKEKATYENENNCWRLHFATVMTNQINERGVIKVRLFFVLSSILMENIVFFQNDGDTEYHHPFLYDALMTYTAPVAVDRDGTENESVVTSSTEEI